MIIFEVTKKQIPMRYKVIESTNNKAYIQCKGERMSIFMPKHEAVDMCIRLNAIVKFR